MRKIREDGLDKIGRERSIEVNEARVDQGRQKVDNAGSKGDDGEVEEWTNSTVVKRKRHVLSKTIKSKSI
jgi:hypothetical protein